VPHGRCPRTASHGFSPCRPTSSTTHPARENSERRGEPLASRRPIPTKWARTRCVTERGFRATKPSRTTYRFVRSGSAFSVVVRCWRSGAVPGAAGNDTSGANRQIGSDRPSSAGVSPQRRTCARTASRCAHEQARRSPLSPRRTSGPAIADARVGLLPVVFGHPVCERSVGGRAGADGADLGILASDDTRTNVDCLAPERSDRSVRSESRRAHRGGVPIASSGLLIACCSPTVWRGRHEACSPPSRTHFGPA